MSAADWLLTLGLICLAYGMLCRLIERWHDAELYELERNAELENELVTIKMEVKKLNPEAVVPSKSRTSDAAYDMYAVEDTVIPAKSHVVVSTGIAIAPPLGWFYTINGRSGMGSKGIVPFRGIVDTGYTGEVKVVLYNHTSASFTVQRGNRIAQITPHRVTDVEFKEVQEFSSDYSLRGDRGFGSSGS